MQVENYMMYNIIYIDMSNVFSSSKFMLFLFYFITVGNKLEVNLIQNHITLDNELFNSLNQ